MATAIGTPSTPSVLAGRVVLVVLLLAGWEWAHRALGAGIVAEQLSVAARIYKIALDGSLAANAWATMKVTLVGLVAGITAGVLLPLLLANAPRLTRAIEPYVMASMGIPKFALAPLLILWFGIGDSPKLVVVALMVFYVVFVTTFAGVRAVDPRLVSMARIAGADAWWVRREVLLPSLLPFLFAGLKVALPRGLSACIVGEFLVADHGLGFYIENSRQGADTVGVYAGLVVVTALVLLLDAVMEWAGRRALAWRPKDAGHG